MYVNRACALLVILSFCVANGQPRWQNSTNLGLPGYASKTVRYNDMSAEEKAWRDVICIRYLKRYGYLQGEEYTHAKTVTAALKRFQTTANVVTSGDMSDETLGAMFRPRCQLPDEYPDDKIHGGNRTKRFVLSGDEWDRRHLSYKVLQYSTTSTLSQAEQDSAFKDAFELWGAVTTLTFTSLSCEPVDIAIAFAKGAHPQFLGDTAEFDGPSNILAHAYSPCGGPTFESLCGDAHFDDDETWVKSFTGGIHLTKVAAHEFGHSLGLRHTTVPGSLMNPIYSPFAPVGPTADDIAGIRAIYGDENTPYSVPGVVDNVPSCPGDTPPTTTTTTPTTTTTTPTTSTTTPTTTTTTPTTTTTTPTTTTTTPTTTTTTPTTTTTTPTTTTTTPTTTTTTPTTTTTTPTTTTTTPTTTTTTTAPTATTTTPTTTTTTPTTTTTTPTTTTTTPSTTTTTPTTTTTTPTTTTTTPTTTTTTPTTTTTTPTTTTTTPTTTTTTPTTTTTTPTTTSTTPNSETRTTTTTPTTTTTTPTTTTTTPTTTATTPTTTTTTPTTTTTTPTTTTTTPTTTTTAPTTTTTTPTTTTTTPTTTTTTPTTTTTTPSTTTTTPTTTATTPSTTTTTPTTTTTTPTTTTTTPTTTTTTGTGTTTTATTTTPTTTTTTPTTTTTTPTTTTTTPTTTTTTPTTTTTKPTTTTTTPTTTTTTPTTTTTTPTTTTTTSSTPPVQCPFQDAYPCGVEWSRSLCKRSSFTRKKCPYLCRICRRKDQPQCRPPLCFKSPIGCKYETKRGRRPSKAKCRTLGNRGKDFHFCTKKSRYGPCGLCRRLPLQAWAYRYCPVTCGVCDPQCRNIRCRNGGTLVMKSCKCRCRAGFTGRFCQRKQCRKNRCQNGGTPVSKFCKCRCRPGYTGKYCQKTNCRNIRCRNGGTLVIRSCMCHCRPRFTGKYCQKKYCPPREHRVCRSARNIRNTWPPFYCHLYPHIVPFVCPYMCGVCKAFQRTKCAKDPRCHNSGGCMFLGVRPTKAECKSKRYNYGKDKHYCQYGARRPGKWNCWHCDHARNGPYRCPQMCSRCPS